MFTTWQAMHTCMIWYLASRACTYRFCKLASSVRMAVYYFASSVQIRTCANFCTGSLGTHPKPRNHTSCELRVFSKTLNGSKRKLQIRRNTIEAKIILSISIRADNSTSQPVLVLKENVFLLIFLICIFENTLVFMYVHSAAY